MHIAIVNLTGGGLSGGYRKYLQAILPRIESDPRVERVELFMPPGVELDGVNPARTHSWAANSPKLGFRTVSAQLKQMRPDVVFVPTARWLDCGDTPLVSMVRNMEALAIPFSPRHPIEIAKNLARRRAALKSCRRSDGVIAVSAFVQDFLRRNWRIPSDKLTVVYHGATSPHDRLDPKRPRGFPAAPNGPLFFTAGSIRPARGLEDAIKAVGSMLTEGHQVTLAIAGSVDPRMDGYWKYLQQLAGERKCASNIIWLGQLDSQSMSWGFLNCDAFVMTSRVEACPNTALEAMAHGCVCVSTDRAPMPEMFGDAAVYYKAGDSDSLSRLLKGALSNDTNSSSKLRERALARATHFSWESSARATVDFLAEQSRSIVAARPRK